jgi:hypothetical protein
MIRSKIVYLSSGEATEAKKKCRDKMVGTRLKNLIKWFPVPKKTGCASCSRLERKMNAWGPEKCLVKMPYILAKLRIAAKRRGLPFSERLVKLLVEKAING